MDHIPRVVPWINWDEWMGVYNCLFSLDMNDQKWAIEVIELWRMRGRIPHAIEISASLIEAMINDNQFLSPNHIRMQYSMVVIRAVNGLIDPSQQSFFADSVLNLAAKIDIPGWIVEIRHDATHNSLPVLSVLRSAATFLIEWLKKNYWQSQMQHIENLSSLCTPGLLKKSNISGVNFHDSCPTLLLDFFLYNFITNISTSSSQYFDSLDDPVVFSDDLFKNEICRQKELWMDFIKSAVESSRLFSIVLIFRLFIDSKELVEKYQKNNSSKREDNLAHADYFHLKINEFWVNTIYDSFLVNIPVETTQRYQFLLHALLNNYPALHPKLQTYLSPILEVICKSLGLSYPEILEGQINMNKDDNKHTSILLPFLDQTVECNTLTLPQNERSSNDICNFSEIMPIDQKCSDNTRSSHNNNNNSSTCDHSNYILHEVAPTKWKVASSSSYGILPCGISSYGDGNLNISKSLVYIKES